MMVLEVEQHLLCSKSKRRKGEKEKKNGAAGSHLLWM
jgi:hypothetical protein